MLFTKEEDAKIIAAALAGRSAILVARELGRSPFIIRRRAQRLGAKFPDGRGGAAAQFALRRRGYGARLFRDPEPLSVDELPNY